MRRLDNSALSDLIGYLMILMIVTSAMGTVFFVFGPFVEEKKMSSQVNSVFIQFGELDDKINSVLSQGANTSITSDVKTEAGTISISETGERIIIYYRTEAGSGISGCQGFKIKDLEDGDNRLSLKMDNDFSGMSTITLLALDLITGETDSASLNPSSSIFRSFQFNFNLINSIMIDLVDDRNGIIFGRIWIFDTGAINYELPSSFGTFRTAIKNDGIIVAESDSSYLFGKNPTNFYIDRTTPELAIKCIQIKQSEGSQISSSGMGTTRISVNCSRFIDEYVKENKEEVKYLRIQFHNLDGLDGDVYAWEYYFKDEFGFIDEPDVNVEGIFYDGDLIFSLVHWIVYAGIEVIE